MRPLKIFVVDDDPDFSEGLALTLEIAGHTVELASTGEEALEKLKNQDFDVTLLDFRMPGMDGVESFKQIRKVKPDTKVIMMTAYGVQERLKQAIDGGVLGVLNKPISERKLLDALVSAQLNGAILLVDDDPDFADAVEITLKQAGYSVLVASTGREALDMMQDSQFDVMLLDLRLPVFNGLEVYAQLKEQDRVPPTVIITGYATQEADMIDQLKNLSVTDVMTKPVRSADLLQVVDQLCRETRQS